MKEETKKFLYEDEVESNNDNINKSKRMTDNTDYNAMSPRDIIGSNTTAPFSPGVVYKDTSDNKGVFLSPFGGERRSYLQRTFGPMKQGSIRGSIFSLCAVAIGAGVLSLPYVLAQTGWILGSILIMVGALSGYFSMYMILMRSIETKCKNFSELA